MTSGWASRIRAGPYWSGLVVNEHEGSRMSPSSMDEAEDRRGEAWLAGERRRLGSAGGERDNGSRTAKPSQSTPGLGSLEPRSERATGRREGRRRPAKLGGEFAGVARGGGEQRRRRSTPEGLPVGAEEGKRDRVSEGERGREIRERERVLCRLVGRKGKRRKKNKTLECWAF